MSNSYEELKKITDKYYTDWKMPKINIFIDLLNKNGIYLRNDDGDIYEINFSIPTSQKDSIMLGIRYKKKDESFSEDLFLFQKNKGIEKGYKGRLQKKLKEYKKTHKLPPNT